MKKTIVILLSDKRSGSTMFQDEICKHLHIRTVDYSPHTYLETHHWLKAAVMLKRPASEFGSGRIHPGYGSKANARTYMEDLLVKNLAQGEGQRAKISQLNDKQLIFDGWEALCQKFAQPVFFEKSPQHLAHRAALKLILDWISTTDFEVKIIGLTRNPLSVQYSAWQLFHTPPEQRQFGWIEIQKNLLWFKDYLTPDSFMHIKYEDLIANPQESFAHICHFIGVEPNGIVGKDVHAESLTKWKDDPYFTLRLDESVKDVARKFGYSEEELNNPEKPEPPLHWKARKKLEASYKLGKARLKDRLLKPIMLRTRGGESVSPSTSLRTGQ